MIKELKLHWQFAKYKTSERMTYRADFFVSALAFSVIHFLGPLFVLAIYDSGGMIPGWNRWELILMQGSFSIIQGIASIFFFGIVWNVEERVQKGELEVLMTKPVNLLWFLAMDSFDVDDIGQLIAGLAISGASIYYLVPLEGSIPLFLLFIGLGLALMFGLALLMSSMAIRFVKIGRLFEIFQSLTNITKYPKNIYGKGLKTAFSTVMPLFVLSYYPAGALLGADLGGGILISVCTLLVLIGSKILWNSTIKHYQGAGG